MAANLALTGMIVALLNFHFPTVPVWALLLLATALGLVMGMINGLLVWKLGIPAIVVTLGTMSIYRGIIFLLSDGGWVNSHQMSADFLGLPRASLLGLPVLSWCAVAALLLVGYFLRFSRTGRALYTAGGNATAAYYTGINAGKMQFVSFCLSGALAGFCGYLWISRFAVAYVDVANGFELQVVAACVIGGISTMGGTGRVVGCLCGALFLGIINNALPVIGISPAVLGRLFTGGDAAGVCRERAGFALLPQHLEPVGRHLQLHRESDHRATDGDADYRPRD